MKSTDERQRAFLDMLELHKGVIARVCSVYASASTDFGDLYQDIVANLWQGFDKFRGESKLSTWIYRVAINTCITTVKRNRHSSSTITLDEAIQLPADDSDRMADYRYLQSLIAQLKPMEKAIVTLWLDENSYEEIASITGLTRTNVAVSLHRIKTKLSNLHRQ